jgi:uncharacterized protein (DUF433 family)
MAKRTQRESVFHDVDQWDAFRRLIENAMRARRLVPRAIEEMTGAKIKQTKLYDFLNRRQRKMAASDIRLLEPILGFKDGELIAAVPLPIMPSAAAPFGNPRIVLDVDILAGKPIVRGTRLSVEFLLGLLADGWDEQDILENYPSLVHEDILACLAYARDAIGAEKIYPSAA